MSNIDQQGGAQSGLQDAAQKAADQAKQAAQKVADQAKKTAKSAVDTGKSALADAQSEAGKIATDAADKAMSFAAENKGKVAEQIGGLGSALNKAAEELENSNQPMIAGYARQLAGGIEQVSTTIRDKGVEDLLAMAGRFARNQPAAFIGGAAVLGFIASRFAVTAVQSPSHETNRSRSFGESYDEVDRGVAPGSAYGKSEAPDLAGGEKGNDLDSINEAFGKPSGTGAAGQWGGPRSTPGGTY